MTEAEWLTSEDPSRMLKALTDERAGAFPGHFPSGRKLRLFACAVWTRHALKHGDDLFLKKIRLVEEWADGEAARPSMLETVGLPDAVDAATLAAEVSVEPGPAGKAALYREIVGNPYRPFRLPRNPAWDDWHAGGGHGRVDMPEPPLYVRPAWLTPTVCGLAQVIYDTGDFAACAVLSDALEEVGCRSDGEEAVPGVYVCERCDAVTAAGAGGIRCGRCGSEFVRKQRARDLPHPLLLHLRIGPSSEHSPRCGAAFRGCAPDCPKARWERNGPHVRGCWALDLILGKE